jgi:hypothetical protein
MPSHGRAELPGFPDYNAQPDVFQPSNKNKKKQVGLLFRKQRRVLTELLMLPLLSCQMRSYME